MAIHVRFGPGGIVDVVDVVDVVEVSGTVVVGLVVVDVVDRGAVVVDVDALDGSNGVDPSANKIDDGASEAVLA